MSKNYTYPHVNLTTRAKLRRTPAAEVSTATTLLAPFTCDRGPENELVAIDTMSAFTATFGGLNYSTPDQRQILYIGEWLRSGGRVLACRITDYDDVNGAAKKATGTSSVTANSTAYKVTATAKYSGEYYNNISINISQSSNSTKIVNVEVIETINSKAQVIEVFRNKHISDFDNICDSSDYIGELYVQDSKDSYIEDDIEKFAAGTITVRLAGGANVEDNYLFGVDSKDNDNKTSCSSNLKNKLLSILEQPLTTPFDVMIDCGYCETVKDNLVDLFTNNRSDAFLYLSNYVILNNGRINKNNSIYKVDNIKKQSGYNNIAINDYYEKVTDLYSEESGKEVYVPTTYFIAGLLPNNDATNGCQWPLAGKTRGVIKNCKWINELPTNEEKQEHYDDQVNYIEADTDGKFIMTQLTLESDDTALKFINNSRSLLKMKKELTVLARNYLHEFNDRITRNNLKQTLDSYLNAWIQNRTLSKGSIEIQDYTQNDTLTNEELQILVDVKFTGTIEIISFDITVE